MTSAHFAPAGLIGLIAVLPSLALRVLPTGPATVLVRTGAEPGAAADVAVRSGAVLMSVPAPGYAVLTGDGSRIRTVTGLAVQWNSIFLCRSRP
jgi:hypothetical protein